MPSSSRTRRRSDSVRGLMPGHARSSSLKRRGPSDRSWSMTAVHFAPMISAVHATEHCSSCTGRMVRIRTFYATGRTPSTALPVRGWLAARCEPTPESWPRPSDSGCCACAGSVVSRNGTSRHRVCRTRTSRASRRDTGHRRPMRSRKIASRLGVSAEYLATGRELPPAGDRELRLGDAELRLRLGDPGAAEEAIREVLADARAVGDAPVAHRALVALAIAADRRDRPREVVELFEEVVESERPPIVDAPEVYALLGRSYDALGEVARAASLFTRCLTELRGAESVDPILCVRFATHLSTALADAGDTAGAERALADALARADAVTERYTLIRLYWSLGRFYAERGPASRALDYVRRAIALLEATEDTFHLARAHQLAAPILLDRASAPAARRHLDRAESLLGVQCAERRRRASEHRAGQARARARARRRGSSAAAGRRRARRARDRRLARARKRLAGTRRRPRSRGRARARGARLPRRGAGRSDQGADRFLADTYRGLGKFLRTRGRDEEALDAFERAADLAAGPS